MMAGDDTLTDISIIGESNDEEKLMKILLRDQRMCFEENRRNTFVDWPFSEPAKCTADAMAEAGFIHIPSDGSPDSVQCFFCCKELDGWEPNDDPWEEHVSHARGKCKFLRYANTYETEISLKKFMELEIERHKNIEKAYYEKLVQRFKDQAAVVRKQMENLV